MPITRLSSGLSPVTLLACWSPCLVTSAFLEEPEEQTTMGQNNDRVCSYHDNYWPTVTSYVSVISVSSRIVESLEI